MSREATECSRCDTLAPHCEHTVTDDWRAEQLAHATEILLLAGADRERLRFLPRDPDDSKKLEHFELGEGALDRDEVQYYEYSPEEAIEAVRNGHPGFAVYYGMERYGTEETLAIDVDRRDTFPYDDLPRTTKFISGSGGGDHLPYHNAGDVENATGSDDVEGEVRANRLYTLLPGSIHNSGGIYEIDVEREPAALAHDDLPDTLKPTTHSDETPTAPTDADGEGGLPDDESVDEVLQKAFESNERIKKVYNGKYKSAGFDDRSKAEFYLANQLDSWVGHGDRKTVERLMDKANLQKWPQRPDRSYRDSVLSNVGYQDWYYDPDYYDDEDEPSSSTATVLPVAALEHLDPVEKRRFAKRRGVEWPSVDEVRERLHDTIVEAVDEEKTVVVDSPTGSGKTHTCATEDWLDRDDITDGKPVIHAHKTKEARQQAAQMSHDADLDVKQLRGRDELCPLAAGEFDPENDQGNAPITIDGVPVSDFINDRCDNQGIPFSMVHQWVEQELNRPVPCCDDDADCPGKTQFVDVPRDDEGNVVYDIIHCTHQFLMVPSLRMHTNIFIDEKPDFSNEISPEMVRRSVTAFLQWADAPVDNFTDLLIANEHGCEPENVGAEMVDGVMINEYKKGFEERMTEALDDQPEMDWYRTHPGVHALAPALTRAIWNGEETADDRLAARVPYRPPRLDDAAHDHSAWNRVFVDVVLDSDREVAAVKTLPDFMLARSVVGLDAHPQPNDPIWQANVHPDIETEKVLNTEERALYRRYERGLFVVQVGQGTQPITSGKWLDEGQGTKIRATIDRLRQEYGDDFSTAITSGSAEEFVRDAMQDADIDDPRTMHYGEEESRNDFAGERAGFVAGSIDPGDEHVMNTVARLGLDARPVYKDCPHCDGGRDDDGDTCDTCNGEGEVREKGRTFEGEDADMAEAVLRTVREHHVAQSAGRWARDPEDPEDNATVYVMTDATPTGFVDAEVPGVTWCANEAQQERLEYLSKQPTGATAAEIAEECGCDKSTAWRTLERAAEEGIVERHPNAGEHGATIYTPSSEFSTNGAVEVSETNAGRVYDHDTWITTIDTSVVCLDVSDTDVPDPFAEQAPLDPFLTGPPPG